MDRLRQVLNSPLGRRKNGVVTPKVFGVSLDDLVKTRPHSANLPLENGNSHHSALVPFIVDRICRFIFANGMEEEGIFRVNGNARVIEKLKECFEKHADADLESSEDIFAVAGLLKLFLRELPESVIPESMTSKFVHCQEVCKQDKAECIRKLKILLDDLPKPHYDTLKYIIRFLVDVAAKESNKMSPMGLAIVFGPNLFRCSSGIEGLRDQGVTNEIVCKLLNEYATIFGELTEPGPFTVPHIHQNREKTRRQAPARPPPPKFTDNNPTLTVPMEFSEDIRPMTSLSQEFMRGASPFTIADGDGHSSIASPVLSAVASELVTKTISEAVLEHIFSATEVRSIFDHWGECDDASSRGSTPYSTIHHHNRRTNSNLSHNHKNDDRPDTVHSGKDVATPQPRPRTTSSDETPQPKPRVNRQNSKTTDLVEETLSNSQQTEPPKPKPRTKSAPARHGSLGEVLHHSIDMPVVNSQHNHTNYQRLSSPQTPVEDQMQQSHLLTDSETERNVISEHNVANHSSSVTSSSQPHVDNNVGEKNEFDSIKSSINVLQHFKKPKGPAKRVPRRQKSLSILSDSQSSAPPLLTGSQIDTDSAAQTSHYVQSDINNNAHKDNLSNGSDKENQMDRPLAQSPVPKLDLEQLDRRSHSAKKRDKHMEEQPNQPPPVIVHTAAEDSSPAPSHDEPVKPPSAAATPVDTLEVSTNDLPIVTTPQGDKQIEGLTPEPKNQRNEADEEKRQAETKALNKKINTLKKKIRAFEEGFEAEHGKKPTTQEKNAKLEIKKALVELAKSRKELKNLKEQADSARVDSIEPPAASTDNSRPESVVHPGGTSSEPPTMADTLELLLKRLKDKRQEANRDDDLSTLTRDQVQEEKLAVQKALLHFESIHGRPQSKSEKELMRPLYDRYRQIKKALATAPISKPETKTDAEGDPTDILVTQRPEGDHATHNAAGGLQNGDEEDGEEGDKTGKETNLQHLPVPELKSELDKANNTKKKLRKLLRDFEDEFQRENGRKVQREDRGPMDNKYQEYKQIKAKIKLLEVLISKHEGS